MWDCYLCKCSWNILKICRCLKRECCKVEIHNLWLQITQYHLLEHKGFLSLWKHRVLIQVESNFDAQTYNTLWIKLHFPHNRKVIYNWPCIFINKNQLISMCPSRPHTEMETLYLFQDFFCIWISMCSSLIYNLYRLKFCPHREWSELYFK